ncbi:hypothetical protein GCM10025771_29120 [Niveibacterium umoris]|uniref:Sulfotransferase family protein n=1 Tax=Niveibacterium umoris TaxID=1193620 RepID=A0A840BFE4_9RHOO|nr:hypothetical protein [Niveibacterium umoris]MBB4011895.1 hypothetical protein [Niveibacterium umoris]
MSRDFCVTCYGLAASRWVSFVLASHPKVFVAHGTYELDSIMRGSFDSERTIGKESDNLDALERGRELHRLIKRSPLKALYDQYRALWPQAEVYGNVHSFVPVELYAKPDISEMDLNVVNLLRHPVSFVDCHNTIVLQAQQTEELKQHYETMYARQVLPALERDGALDPSAYVSLEDKAFLISCFSVVGQAKDLIAHPMPAFRMEQLTTDGDALAGFCRTVTGFEYDPAALAAFIAKGSINNHRKKEALRQPAEIYAAWSPRYQRAFEMLIARPYREVFGEVGYPLA